MINKNKAKLTLLLLTVFVIVLFTGCGAKKTTTKTALEKIGVITMGNSPDYPPFETIDDKGNIVGFDVDVANAIAKELGVKLEIKQMGFDTIITAVQSGQVDIGMSGFSITPERKEKVEMSTPYLVGGQVIVTTKDSGIKSAADLNGQKVAVGIGSTCEKAAQTIKGANVVSLDDFNVGFVMLKSKSVKAVVADITVANNYVAKDSTYVIVDKPLTYEETAAITKKGNTDLIKAINDAISKLEKEGKIKEYKSKWKIQ
jgi:arginine/lysine/histidine transporter system substrate-binding protein